MRVMLLLVSFAIALSACTVSAPQIDNIFNAFARGEKTEVVPPTWLAKVGEVGATLTPYSTEGLTVFANADGDAIAFDGWNIRSIIGFELPHPISTTSKNNEKITRLGSETARTSCSRWERRDDDFGLIWRQKCGPHRNVITVDKQGNITAISSDLGVADYIVTIQLAL